jgi:uncharacterized protein (TIGR02246 family)
LLCSGKTKRRFSRPSHVALACALLCALTGFLSGCRVMERSQTDRALIEQLVKRADDGWRKRDAIAATADYIEDAELILPNGRILQSREVIQAAQKQMLAGQAENKTDDQSRFDDSIRFIAPEVAVVTRTFPAGLNRSGHSLRVLLKRDNRWRITAEEIMIDLIPVVAQ